MTWQVGIGFWFGLSVVLEFLGSVGLRLWLAYHRVEIPFMKAGRPFYLDRRYREWAEQTGRSPRLILGIRTFVTFNMVIAGLILVAMLGGGPPPHQR